MSDREPPPAGPRACAAIADTMIGHFATRLEVEARKRGGTLTPEAIRALAESFLAKDAPRFAPALQRSWDECTRARQTLQWDSSRTRPFERILTKPFAHLFPARQGDDGGDGLLSRRLLPGFALAVTKMIGPALYEQCQNKAQAVLDRHRRASGGYDWAAIHADPETRALTQDALVVVAHHFAQFRRRRDWFLDVVNSHLAPAQGADASWRLTEHGFAEMMRALFAAIGADMDGLRRRHGEQTAAMMAAFIRKLD